MGGETTIKERCGVCGRSLRATTVTLALLSSLTGCRVTDILGVDFTPSSANYYISNELSDPIVMLFLWPSGTDATSAKNLLTRPIPPGGVEVYWLRVGCWNIWALTSALTQLSGSVCTQPGDDIIYVPVPGART